MMKIDSELKKSVQEIYLDTIDKLDYKDRKKIANDNLLDSEELKNSNGKTYAIIAVHEDNALLYDPSNEYHPYTVARGVYPSLRSWINASYHGEYKIAKEEFNKYR